MKTIAIICAIPQESRPILRRLAAHRRTSLQGIPLWQSESSGQQLFLVESGMGTARATAAAESVIGQIAPDLVISAGFCGALLPGLDRGAIVLAERLLAYPDLRCSAAVSIDQTLLTRLAAPADKTLHRGTFITTPMLVAKNRVRTLLDEQLAHPVLEMESHAVGTVCARRGVPFAAIRAVSDGADQDPHLDCSKIFAADMKISIMQILKAIIVEPALGRRLLQLRQDAGVAGNSLAQAVALSLGRLQ